MLSLYVQPATNFLPAKEDEQPLTGEDNEGAGDPIERPSKNHRDPIAFLYYSIVLTCLTVMVAIVIGVIQILTLVLNVANPTGRFWDGVQIAGDYYDAIGGGIAGCFLIVGIISVFLYKPWRRWVARRHGKMAVSDEEGRRQDQPITIVTDQEGPTQDESPKTTGKGHPVQVHVTANDGPA